MGAHLRLTAFGMMEAQIVGGLCHQRVKLGVAGEAKNVVAITAFFYPLHRLDAAVVTRRRATRYGYSANAASGASLRA